jgi:hypothetical protein
MRKFLPILTLAAAAAIATPAFAEPAEVNPNYSNYYAVAPVVAGAAVGTAVGVGIYNGWYSGAFAAAAPTTVAGAVAVGGVAGIGTIALLDAATQRCRGFGIFWARAGECVNGEWVGDQPNYRMRRRTSMR